MVSFRKLVLVLAVIGLMAGIASAQISSCQVSAPNFVVRYEGLTEPIGQVVITCPVTNPSTLGSTTANFTVKLNGATTFTNSTTGTGTDTSATATTAAGTVKGVYGASANEIDFNNVQLGIGASATAAFIVLDNLRVNAFAAGNNTTITANFTGTSVTTPTTGFSQNILVQSGVTVATVQQGLTFSVSNASSLTQCSGASATAKISFKPNFAYAFRPATGANSEPTESNANATKGVQLVAIFSGLPSNVTLTVPNTLVGANNTDASGNEIAGTGAVATLVSPTPDSGATTKVTPTGATQQIVYQVTTLNSSALTQALTGTVSIASVSGKTIGTGQIQVRGNLGPISTSTGSLASTDKNNIVPRFTDLGSTAANFVNVIQCQTTLLFPYVVSAGGFDTGIAIANTAKDIQTGNTWLFGGSSELSGSAGTCTLNYFGGSTAAATQTSAAIAPGAVEVFLVGQDSLTDAGIKARPGFQGYMIANCNFVNAHGFAFITSGPSASTGGGMTMGYNALVIPTSSRTAAGGVGNNSETLGQ